MLSTIDVYIAYKRAQGKAYRVPKDWEIHLANMQTQNREALQTATDFFNTKWRNIDVDKFMRCGFELYSRFTYVKFFDKRVFNLYVTKDKNEKRECEYSKVKVVESAKYIKRRLAQLEEKETKNLKRYARLTSGVQLEAVSDYIKGRIDPITFYYLIHKRYLILDDENRSHIPYIDAQLRPLKSKVTSIYPFLEKVEESINAK